ncbi:MAG: UbiA family prenyltransferase [Methanomassiliicoccus sp.]|nr:UbiA family prenyltransferase [Methanomassiliicoccus sp.]
MNRYVQLFRVGNCVMGVVGLVLAALIAVGTDIVNFLPQIAIASGVVVTFIIGGNTLNDYLDRDVDKLAHPERPIPSGRIKPDAARNISAGAFVISLAFAVLLWGVLSFIIVLVAIVLMLAYELKTKKMGLSGNLSIAVLTGMLFLLGGAVVGDIRATLAISIMAMLATLGREIVKDVQDMTSDFDRRTLPQRIGAGAAGAVASVAFLVAVALSFEPYLAGRFGLAYLAAVLFADAIFIYCSIVHFRNPRQGQKWAKYGMLVALVSFLLGGLL